VSASRAYDYSAITLARARDENPRRWIPYILPPRWDIPSCRYRAGYRQSPRDILSSDNPVITPCSLSSGRFVSLVRSRFADYHSIHRRIYMWLHNKFPSCTRNFGPPFARYPFAGKSRPITSEASCDLRIANCSVIFYANDKSNKGLARARRKIAPQRGGINRAAKSGSESPCDNNKVNSSLPLSLSLFGRYPLGAILSDIYVLSRCTAL